jgi:hypothetical protein
MHVRPPQPTDLAAELLGAHDAAAAQLLLAAVRHLEQAAKLEREAAETDQEADADAR